MNGNVEKVLKLTQLTLFCQIKLAAIWEKNNFRVLVNLLALENCTVMLDV